MSALWPLLPPERRFIKHRKPTEPVDSMRHRISNTESQILETLNQFTALGSCSKTVVQCLNCVFCTCMRSFITLFRCETSCSWSRTLLNLHLTRSRSCKDKFLCYYVGYFIMNTNICAHIITHRPTCSFTVSTLFLPAGTGTFFWTWEQLLIRLKMSGVALKVLDFCLCPWINTSHPENKNPAAAWKPLKHFSLQTLRVLSSYRNKNFT